MKPAYLIAPFVLYASSAVAHDFWLASSEWHLTHGRTIVLTANVGDDIYPRSDSATAPERVDFLRVVGPTALTLTPRYRMVGQALATDITLPSPPGTYMAVMVVKGRFLSMEGDKFIEYLKEEGLDHLVGDVQRHGETTKRSRERYWRDAKALIRAGDGPSEQVTRPVGLPAELIPDTDLTAARVGETISVRLLADGQPVANAQVRFTAAAPGPTTARVVHSRTDAQGRARFVVAKRGPYLLTSVYMVRREGETGAEAADWESYWCSLTFDVQSRDR